MVYGIGFTMFTTWFFFFTSCLHSLSIPSQEHEEELGPREQRRTTGEGREPEDLEIWMNKNDDEPWFLGVQFFGGTQFWPLLTQSHVFLGLKHLKKNFGPLCDIVHGLKFYRPLLAASKWHFDRHQASVCCKCLTNPDIKKVRCIYISTNPNMGKPLA